jgi:hypothetical protein
MSHYNPLPGEPFVFIEDDRTYKTWTDIRRKARKAKVCDRWNESYQNFYDDLGQKPEGTILGRHDPDGEFSPENCAWVTRKELAAWRRKPTIQLDTPQATTQT